MIQLEQETAPQARTKNEQILWTLGFGSFLVNADNRAITPMLPAIAQTFHTDAAAAAWLVTAYSIPYGLFQLVYGPLADRIGKVKTILLSLCLFSIGTIACGFIDSFAWLVVLRFITGTFAAGIIPTTLALIGDQYDMAERPRAIAFIMSLSTTGQALGIVIGGLVAQFASFHFLFFIVGLVALPSIGVLFLLRKQGAAHSGETMPLGQRYLALAKNRRARTIYSLVFIEGFLFFGGFTFLGVYGVTVLHLSYFVIGLLIATYSVGGFIGSRAITRVLQKVGALRMPMLGAALMGLGYAVVWGWNSVIALTACFVALGVGFSFCHSTLQTYATNLLPQGRATAVSVFAFSLFIGSGIGPIAAGSVYKGLGYHAMLGAAAAALILFSALCTLLLRRTVPAAA